MKLNKPEKYEEIQVNEDFERLELGGHKGIIKKVEEYTSQVSGNTSLKVEVDTAKDDKQPEYFTKQYNSNNDMNKKWSTGATKYVSLKQEENCIKMLKGFITAVENSNPNFKYDWNKDVDQLVGKKVGLVFGWEEYENQEGEVKLATKLNQFRSIDKIDNVLIPNVKTYDGSFVSYDDYVEMLNNSKNSAKNNPFEIENAVEIDPNFLD